MSVIAKRAIRLAVILEAVSCITMLYQDEPLSGWNSWAVSLGWSTHVVANVLVMFFVIVHFPVLILVHFVHGDAGFMVCNGRLTPTSVWFFIAMLLQCALWSLVFFGLMHLEKKIRARFRHHDAKHSAGI